MPNSIGEQAVVIGAGMGGLTAAAALSDFFAKVIILERDDLPPEVVGRPGVPQGRHPHALLAGGQQALEELFPGFSDDLLAAGAVRFTAGLDTRVERPGYDPFPQRDVGLTIHAMSRALLEFVVRRHATRPDNIECHANCDVREIIATDDGAAVQAVRFRNGDGETETLAADLVVDASGRGMPTLNFLQANGHALPPESTIGVDGRYSTGTFAIPENAPGDWKSTIHVPDPRVDSHGALLLPIEGGRWIVVVSALHGDAPPADTAGFIDWTRSLRTPTLWNALRDAEPLGQIARFAFPGSVRRHFGRLRAFPRGLLPVADAVCRLNPVFGQGMSVAAQEARVLKDLLRMSAGQHDPLAQLAPAFFAALETVIDTPWGMVSADFAWPQTRGERPPDFEGAMKFGGALVRLAAREPSVHKLMTEVQHLVKPREVYREPAFARLVRAEMEAVPRSL
jgi:2-polyprenyl-6-methoxyphenol hydroxylase-like FAD-dependent oxidoreductase